MSDKVLIDTSVWINFLNKKDSPVSKSVKELLRAELSCYTDIIELELIRGAKSKREIEIINKLLDVITYYGIKKEYYRRAGEMGYSLARKGHSIGIVDLLIAQVAIENDLFLFSLDNHFKLIAKEFPLKIFEG
jgi:hypothetical protein